jgi:hypothetical protein
VEQEQRLAGPSLLDVQLGVTDHDRSLRDVDVRHLQKAAYRRKSAVVIFRFFD